MAATLYANGVAGFQRAGPAWEYEPHKTSGISFGLRQRTCSAARGRRPDERRDHRGLDNRRDERRNCGDHRRVHQRHDDGLHHRWDHRNHDGGDDRSDNGLHYPRDHWIHDGGDDRNHDRLDHRRYERNHHRRDDWRVHGRNYRNQHRLDNRRFHHGRHHWHINGFHHGKSYGRDDGERNQRHDRTLSVREGGAGFSLPFATTLTPVE